MVRDFAEIIRRCLPTAGMPLLKVGPAPGRSDKRTCHNKPGEDPFTEKSETEKLRSKG